MLIPKIKILHIQQSISFGGVERRRLSLAKHLPKNTFTQKIICTDARGSILKGLQDEGVEVFVIGKYSSIFDLKKYVSVQRIIDEYKPDIVHGAVFEGVTMAAINGRLKKVPIIIIEETSDPKNRSWKGNLLMKFFSFLSDKVIGVSEAVTKEYLKGKLNLPENKVHLINNGVAIPRSVTVEEINSVQKELGITKKDFVIGSVGRMLDDANKRFSDLIKAFAIFSKGKDHVKLILVGDGLQRLLYEKLSADLGIKHKIIFAGYQADVTLYYKLMNIFSLVSRNESFGLVLAEAMLNKLPVIATRVGGMKYIVDDNKTGFLVEPYNVQEIADKIEQLYMSPNLCNKFAESGYEKAIREYTEENYSQKIEKLYLELLNKSK